MIDTCATESHQATNVLSGIYLALVTVLVTKLDLSEVIAPVNHTCLIYVSNIRAVGDTSTFRKHSNNARVVSVIRQADRQATYVEETSMTHVQSVVSHTVTHKVFNVSRVKNIKGVFDFM